MLAVEGQSIIDMVASRPKKRATTRSVSAPVNTRSGARQDLRYTTANIPAATLAGLVQFAGDHSHDVERWFSGSGVKAAQTADPDAQLSFRQVVRIVSRALKDCGPIGLGLAVGSQTTVSGLGMLGFSLMSSRDMAQAAAVGEKYHPVSGSLMDVSCRASGHELILEAFERFPEPRLLPFFCEKLFASALATTRGLLGQDYRPALVELSYAEPAYAGDYRRLFQCPVRFNAGHNRLISKPELLQRPLATHSPSTHAETLRLCESRMNAAFVQDEVSSLRQWLRANADRSPTIAEAASALHLHERTLRRRLADAGTNFRSIHDQERARLATALLRDSRIGIAEVAVQLGYSDEREFRRAYKRWTGQIPSAARS
jgi:AraC-like DNA-binding protein